MGTSSPQSEDQLAAWLNDRKKSWKENRLNKRKARNFILSSSLGWEKNEFHYLSHFFVHPFVYSSIWVFTTTSFLLIFTWSNRNGRPKYFEVAQEEGGKKKPLGVADFVRNASLAAMTGYWQVIFDFKNYLTNYFFKSLHHYSFVTYLISFVLS